LKLLFGVRRSRVAVSKVTEVLPSSLLKNSIGFAAVPVLVKR